MLASVTLNGLETMTFGDYRRNLKFFNCKFDGNAVAVCSQAANDTRRQIG